MPFPSPNEQYQNNRETEWQSMYKEGKVKEVIAVNGNPSHSYGVSFAIWDHTVSPATRHKWAHPAVTPAIQAGIDLPTPEGWKAELT